jgi:hypothetical protein
MLHKRGFTTFIQKDKTNITTDHDDCKRDTMMIGCEKRQLNGVLHAGKATAT